MAGVGNLLQSGGININSSQIIGVGSQIATVVIIILAIMFALYLFLYFISFNKKVLLAVQSGGDSVRFLFDRGRKDKKKKEFTLLRYRDIDCYYPDSKDEYPSGTRGTIIPFVVRNNSAVPINGISDNPHFIPADINMQSYLAIRLRRNVEATQSKQSFWDKYGHDVLWGGTIVICFLIILFILKRVDSVIEMGRSIATASVQAGKQGL